MYQNGTQMNQKWHHMDQEWCYNGNKMTRNGTKDQNWYLDRTNMVPNGPKVDLRKMQHFLMGF